MKNTFKAVALGLSLLFATVSVCSAQQVIDDELLLELSQLQTSAEQGDARSQATLGMLHEIGKLTFMQNYKEAVKWYRLSAEQGDSAGIMMLGKMYEQGRGVIKDNIYAHMWLNIAASRSDVNKAYLDDAVNSRDNVAKMMTASQLEKAQDLARKCVKKNFKGC